MQTNVNKRKCKQTQANASKRAQLKLLLTPPPLLPFLTPLLNLCYWICNTLSDSDRHLEWFFSKHYTHKITILHVWNYSRGLQLEPSGFSEFKFHCTYSFLLVLVKSQSQAIIPSKILRILRNCSYRNEGFLILKCNDSKRIVLLDRLLLPKSFEHKYVGGS